MLDIIQDYLKKNNSRILKESLISLYITLILLIIFSIYIFYFYNKNTRSLVYRESILSDANISVKQTSLPAQVGKIFASVNGKTYTFSWCQGADKIKEENKVFFKTEVEAIASGRKLSKLCQ